MRTPHRVRSMLDLHMPNSDTWHDVMLNKTYTSMDHRDRTSLDEMTSTGA